MWDQFRILEESFRWRWRLSARQQLRENAFLVNLFKFICPLSRDGYNYDYYVNPILSGSTSSVGSGADAADDELELRMTSRQRSSNSARPPTAERSYNSGQIFIFVLLFFIIYCCQRQGNHWENLNTVSSGGSSLQINGWMDNSGFLFRFI